MKSEQIQAIKNINNDPEKLENLIGWLKDNKTTVDKIISFCNEDPKNKNMISPGILNRIGFSYDQGKNGLPENAEKAFKLFEFAAVQGDAKAMGYCAVYYTDGLAPQGENLNLAREYCDNAIKGGVNARKLLMGEILYKQQEFKKAIEYLKDVVNNKEFTEKDQKEAKAFEKQCLKEQLKVLYKKLCQNDSKDELAEGVSEIKLEAKEEGTQLPGWTNLSEEIDAFDINDCTELTKRVKVIELEVQAAEAALDVAQKHVDIAGENKLPKKIITALVEKKNAFSETYQKLEEKKEIVLRAYQSYIDTGEQTIRRQVQTEQHFFNPRRTKKRQTFDLAMELTKRRLEGKSIVDPIDLNINAEHIPPARRMITAERSTIESSIEIFGYPKSWYDSKHGWEKNPSPNIPGKRTDADYTYDEKLKIGTSIIQYCQRINSHYNHLGDYYMRDLGSYNNIVSIFNTITGTGEENTEVENEKMLAALMLSFSRDGKPVTIEKLQSIKVDATEENVNNLNKVFYHCFVKEVARWMLPRDEDHKLPLATVQARALSLIKNGYLNIKDVFSQNAPYGVFTGTNIGEKIDKLREKIIKINALYDKAILEKKSNNFLPYIQFWKEHTSAKILPTRQELRCELRQTFGGESDTDGEGYESDNEREKLFSAIKA